MIQVKRIVYVPADIYAMNGAPQLVLAAPAAGYVNNILGISHDMVFNTAAYTGANSFLYQPGSGGNPTGFQDTNTLPSGVDVNLPLDKGVTANLPFTTTKDFYVTTDAVAATGDSDVTAYIVFEVKLYS